MRFVSVGFRLTGAFAADDEGVFLGIVRQEDVIGWDAGELYADKDVVLGFQNIDAGHPPLLSGDLRGAHHFGHSAELGQVPNPVVYLPTHGFILPGISGVRRDDYELCMMFADSKN